MRVFIVGADGYLGWSLGLRLRALGHEVRGWDNLSRRRWVGDCGSDSATPIAAFSRRCQLAPGLQWGDVTAYESVRKLLDDWQPDAIVHLGEMPSAPFSMADFHKAAWAQRNNVLGTLALLWAMHECCPDAHLLKLGTMGEYGTPPTPIPEGEFAKGDRWVRQDGSSWSLAGMIFPKRPGSFYHASKVQDTFNVEMACRLWGLRSTDVHQGVVYGVWLEEMGNEPELLTRFDYDEAFGTAINRFVAQAVCDLPITPYGQGQQQRGFLTLDDSMQCLCLLLDHPPQPGEYRSINQLEAVYTLSQLAQRVQAIGAEMGSASKVVHVPNPRREAEEHSYAPDALRLRALGFAPRHDMDATIRDMILRLTPHRERIAKHLKAIPPRTLWDAHRPPEGWPNDKE